MATAFWAEVASAQLDSSGFPVQNPDWEILVTEFGYADLALDRRPGFVGREYLSGEWAAAIFYGGGSNPPAPVWFQKQWFFPDWESNSTFEVEKTFEIANPANPMNADGFTVYQSIIRNADVRVTITYEMLDSVTGIAQGNAAKSAGAAGAGVTSSRYVFRQTYRITNISGGPLTNVRLFQLMHGLEASKSVYDDRLYAGPMSAYRYDCTQQGDSLGFDLRSGAIVVHHDTITFHSDVAPAAWEAGYYGRLGVDSHETGKPGVGVHLQVETNSLNGTDFFEPAEGGWVGGAQRFDHGNLPANGSVTQSVLFSVQTIDEVKFPGVNIVVHNVESRGDKLFIEFEENSGAPVVFVLLKSTALDKPVAEWEILPLPFISDPQRPPGWLRFEPPINASEPEAFFRIQAFISELPAEP
jgi:hypothetical protein